MQVCDKSPKILTFEEKVKDKTNRGILKWMHWGWLKFQSMG